MKFPNGMLLKLTALRPDTIGCDPSSAAEVLALFAREGFADAAVIGEMAAGPARVEVLWAWTAMQAFSNFSSGKTTTSNQIEFIELIAQELTQSGVMEPDRLFQSPFTDLNAQGPLGIFSQATVTQIVQVLEGIKKRAAA